MFKVLTTLLAILTFSSVTLRGQTAEFAERCEEAVPQFPDGGPCLMSYLHENLRYPTEVAEGRIKGMVVLVFTVQTDGSVTGIRVLKGLTKACDEEVIRLIRNSGKWNSGYSCGKPVISDYMLVIRFRPEDAIKKIKPD